jgi:arsenate reductase
MIGMGKTKSEITIYYNNSCSKSQCALEELKIAGVDFNKVNYIENPLTILELKEIIAKLNCRPHDLIRTKEPIYIQRFADKVLSDEEWISIMHENPILIQRPIIVNGKKAQIARSEDSVSNSLKGTDFPNLI